MEDKEPDLDKRLVNFAKMEDEFFKKWSMGVEDLNEALQYYIEQGEADVKEKMNEFLEDFNA